MTLFNQLKPLIGVIILLVAVVGFAVADAAGANVPDGERNLVYGAVLTALVYEGAGAVRDLRNAGPTPPPASPNGKVTDIGSLRGGDSSRGHADPGG